MTSFMVCLRFHHQICLYLKTDIAKLPFSRIYLRFLVSNCLINRVTYFLVDEGAPDSVIGKALEAFRRYQQDQRSRISPTIQREGEGVPDFVEGGYQIGLSRRRQNRQVATSTECTTCPFCLR